MRPLWPLSRRRLRNSPQSIGQNSPKVANGSNAAQTSASGRMRILSLRFRHTSEAATLVSRSRSIRTHHRLRRMSASGTIIRLTKRKTTPIPITM
jgi:hypothetical protein